MIRFAAVGPAGLGAYGAGLGIFGILLPSQHPLRLPPRHQNCEPLLGFPKACQCGPAQIQHWNRGKAIVRGRSTSQHQKHRLGLRT